jgi:hypothetical protein
MKDVKTITKIINTDQELLKLYSKVSFLRHLNPKRGNLMMFFFATRLLLQKNKRLELKMYERSLLLSGNERLLERL